MNRIDLNDLNPPPLVDVVGLLRTLWQRKLLILVATLSALLATVLYVQLTKPIYTADASIIIDPRDTRATTIDSVMPGIGADSAAIASQVSIIESRNLLGAVFDQMNLQNEPEFSDPGLVARLLSHVKAATPLTRDMVFDQYRNRVSVQREGLTYVIDISFKSLDPNNAAKIVNAIVERYEASLQGQNANANTQVNTMLSGKIGGLQSAVSDAERAIQDFKAQHNIFDATTGGTLQSQIDQLSTQLISAQDQANQAQGKYDQAVAAGTTPQGLMKLSALVTSAVTDALRENYNQKTAALANIEAVYGPRHPTIMSSRAEIAKLEGLMAREAERIIQELKGTRDLATGNVANLQANLDTLRQKSNQSDLAQVELRQLQRNSDAARAVLDDFLKRSAETSQLQGMQMSQVRVISGATPPVQPTWPKPALLLPVGGFLGLAAGVALALGLGAPRRKPGRSPQPQNPTPEGDGQSRSSRGRKAGPISLGSINFPQVPGNNSRAAIKAARLEICRDPEAPLARDIRQLIGQVLDQLSPHDGPQILLVTSPADGIETSLAASVLGIGLQQMRRSVLMVEIVGWSDSPPPLLLLSGERGAVSFTDPSSGLRTMVLGVNRASMGPGWADNAIRPLLIDKDVTADFLLLVGSHLTSPVLTTDLSAMSDLEIIALGAGQEFSGDTRPFADDALAPKAVMVIECAAIPPSQAVRPKLVVSNTGKQRETALSRG